MYDTHKGQLFECKAKLSKTTEIQKYKGAKFLTRIWKVYNSSNYSV